MNQYLDDEEQAKHRKKSSKRSIKANHKHEYVAQEVERFGVMHSQAHFLFVTYECTVCGKQRKEYPIVNEKTYQSLKKEADEHI